MYINADAVCYLDISTTDSSCRTLLVVLKFQIFIWCLDGEMGSPLVGFYRTFIPGTTQKKALVFAPLPPISFVLATAKMHPYRIGPLFIKEAIKCLWN